jgi:NAD(P)-dependent dehydrogenase (short-subunit alcohol dehydrogenase family)
MSAVIQPGAMAGKVALVTGGGSGIGRATSLAFAAAGAQVVVSDIAPRGGEATVEMIRGAGGEALFVRADVTRADEVDALINEAVERYGRLDYAHNNAGIEGMTGSLLDYPEDLFDRVMAINVKGVWLCMRAEIPRMLAQGGGAIVNTASIAGLRGSRVLFAYGASKFAVVGMTKSAAQEFSTRGIRINAVCPGVIDTPMVERAFDPDLINTLAARQMGRLGTADEVAQAVVWLCSDAASFVTGAAMPVDGGSTA